MPTFYASAFRIALAYWLVAALWILFSDHLLLATVSSPDQLTRLQTWKGWFFVSTTAVLLYAFISRSIKRSMDPLARRLAENEMLQQALESVDVGLALYDSEERLVMCNDAYQNLHETAQQIIEPRQKFTDFVRTLSAAGFYRDAPSREKLGERLDELRAGKEWVYFTDSGKWIASRMSELEGGDFFIVNQDISGRKSMEEALRASENRYRQVYEKAPLAFVVWDTDMRITGWNERAEELFGWSSEQAIGQNTVRMLVPANDRSVVSGTMEAMLINRQPAESINENLTAGGGHITCHWSNVLLTDGRNNVVGGISLAMDITDRIAAERALRVSEIRYRELAENLPGVVYMTEDDELVGSSYINRSIESLTGWPRDAFTNGEITVSDFYHPDDQATVRKRVSEAVAQRRPYQFEARIYRRSGAWRWVIESGVGNFDRHGQLQYRQGYLQDITDLKQAQLMLRQLATRLAMTEENERRTLAEYLHDGLGQELALILLQLKKSMIVDDPEERASILTSISKRLASCIDETQRKTLELSPPSLRELGLSAAVESELNSLCADTSVNPSFVCDGNGSEPDFDVAAFVFRATREFIINAIKHSQATTLDVRLVIEQHEICVSVHDNGRGFSMDVDGITSKTGRFGLYSVRERVIAMDGDLQIVRSSEGAEVILRVPRA